MNRSWDGDWLANGDLFSFTEPYPDYDLPALAAYARKTDENVRRLKFQLNFLDANRKYVAEIYREGDDAEWKENPYSILIEKRNITSTTWLSVHLAPGGGAAIRLHPISDNPRMNGNHEVLSPRTDRPNEDK
jgi:hypothetical protein